MSAGGFFGLMYAAQDLEIAMEDGYSFVRNRGPHDQLLIRSPYRNSTGSHPNTSHNHNTSTTTKQLSFFMPEPKCNLESLNVKSQPQHKFH